MAVPEWKVRGPRTLQYALNFIGEHGPTPPGRHSKWKARFSLGEDHPVMVHHELLSRLLNAAVCYDQWQVVNLESFELLGRELQLVEEREEEKTTKSHVESDNFLFRGQGGVRGYNCVSPELREWFADELRRDAAIMKERRKAREERGFQEGPKGGKDGKKGKDE